MPDLGLLLSLAIRYIRCHIDHVELFDSRPVSPFSTESMLHYALNSYRHPATLAPHITLVLIAAIHIHLAFSADS
ncbi:hypothetical protein CVT26_011427 [Gymnopilus dilepis]|uniref:Uncharacterized protein n=1 Tax=Gymnopilus dilepis TaxID=231916 RepID=A0A409X008_9AGAR|nr:hypothetical protein CVT26_011427 [Gymnopilus dilepis]